MHTYYTQYYLRQSGQGLGDIGHVYKTHGFYQRGRGGVGSFFSGLYRFLKPLVSSGFSVLKDQSIKTGKDILSEIGQKPFKQILKEHGKNAANELTQRGLEKLRKKMQKGSGKIKKKSNIKRRKKGKTQHSQSKRRRRKQRTIKKKKPVAKRKRRNKTLGGPSNKKTRFVDIYDNNNG